MSNLSLDMGRQECSLGWTENLLKQDKFKRFDPTDYGFSISAWKSCYTQEMSEIYFSNQIGQTGFKNILS